MFPISIKIVVEEDAVDFGLHLTVPDKRPPPPPAHPLPISPHFINDQRPPPQLPKWRGERKREGEAMGVEKRRGGRLRVGDRAIRGLLSTPIHKQSEIPKFAP